MVGRIVALPSAIAALLAAACAGPGPAPVASRPAATPSVEAAATEPAASATAPDAERTLPTTCSDGPICTPPPEFGQRLCSAPSPEVALYLFGPKTPWKRAYLQRSFQAWHVGGHGELRELHRGEEVLIVALGKSSTQGMQIGGRAFDVLRWDGTCVSLMEDEIDFRRPPAAAPANIDWKKLDPDFQAAFSGDKRITALRTNQERLCTGPIAEKEPGKTKCELARRALSLAIAQAVGTGMALPPLGYVP